MELNLATDYTIRILLYLAESETVATTSEIARSMKIPARQTASLLKNLCKRGAIESQQGRNGGYTLCKRPEEITLYDIIRWTSNTLVINRCVKDKRRCNRRIANSCKVRRQFCLLQEKMESELKAITLRHLID